MPTAAIPNTLCRT